MRSIVASLAITVALLTAGFLVAAPAPAEPSGCDVPSCVPGITPGVVLGTLCDNTSYYVFGVTSFGPVNSQPGRIVFCSAPRNIHPRWFRSPKLVGIKDEGSECPYYLNAVAQAPDGLFLICMAVNGHTSWVAADTRRP